jgi:cytochrome c2
MRDLRSKNPRVMTRTSATRVACRIGGAALLTCTLAATVPAQPAAGGLYSAEQASRGKIAFAASCASCHTADAQTLAASEIPRQLPIALAGPSFLRKWATVRDLFSKVSTSMPVDTRVGVGGLPRNTYVDIVAFLLQANGLPPGRTLTAGSREMEARALTARTTQTASATNAGGPFTAAQAERGRLYFYGSCNTCHISEKRSFEPADLVAGRGFLNGRGVSLLGIVNPERFAERYRNVAAVYNKIRSTMPGHDAAGLSTAAYLDITAYVMSINGIPPGGRELAHDLDAMRATPLLEPGFEAVFNGKDFTGLKFVLGANCRPKPLGCAQTTPGTTFRIDKGQVINTGTPYGYMYTEKQYLNFTLRLDYRFTPVPGVDDSEFLGNSGYLLFIKEHQVWPKYIEIQGQHTGVLGVLSTGGRAVFTVDNDARQRVMKPVGAWNSVEIVSAGGQIKSSLNGVLISTVTEHEYTAGHLGFQAEGSEITWRNIRIKDGDAR